jgi:hypothetical protein
MALEENSPSSFVPRRGLSVGLIALLCVVGLTLIVGVIVALFIQHSQQALRSSRALSLAVTVAGHAPCVRARLGAPIVASGFIVGNVSNSNGQGYADLEIPVHGSLATGRIHIVANATADSWKPQYLSVRTGTDRLLLLPAAPPCQ